MTGSHCARWRCRLLLALASLVAGFSEVPGASALPRGASAYPPSGIACRSLNIQVLAPPSPLVERGIAIFTRRVQQRSGVEIKINQQAQCSLQFAVQTGIGTEGFRIESVSGNEVRITGNDERGLLYGIGKILRTSTYAPSALTLGTWRGASVPKDPVRGVYFATHFHNFYNDGPIDEIRRYVEDLSLWGVNALSVAYDMHMYAGIEDPEAQAMLQRLRVLFETARGVGMRTGLMLGANQAYNNSPEELRAVGPGRGEFNATDLCPHKPGAREMLLKQFSQEFEFFAPIGVDYVTIWPYDASSCGCNLCRPWGSNGFLYIAEPTSRLARRFFPDVRVTLATWLFDQNEWEGIAHKFHSKPDWVDYLLAEPLGRKDAYFLNHEVPGNIPLMGFPEISMAGMFPWGGFGANPQPTRFQQQWELVKDRDLGGFPYSEGIYEDLNKVIFAQFYWNPDRDALDTVREYLAYECWPSVVDELVTVVKILEQNHHYRWWSGKNGNHNFPGQEQWWMPPEGAVDKRDARAEEAFRIVQDVLPKLPPYTRSSWRWRILYLRALLDEEFKRNPYQPSNQAKHAVEELTGIYHAEHTHPALKPAL